MSSGEGHGTAGSAGRVTLAAPEVAAELTSYLARLRRLDDACVLRLVVRGSALGVFACPPMQVIAFRAFPLADGGGQVLDVTVRADQIRTQGAGLVVPSVVPTPAWAGVLPPRSGWAELGELPAEDVLEAVRAGVAAFTERSAGVPDAHRSTAVTQRIAEEIWAARLIGDLPLRAAHAASVLGLLSPRKGGNLAVRGAAGWLRLEGHHGVVFLRRPGAPGITFA